MVLDKKSVKASARKLNGLVEAIAQEVEEIIKVSGLEGVGVNGIKSELFGAISAQLAERLQTQAAEKKAKGILEVSSSGVLIRDDIGIRLLPFEVFLTNEQKKRISKDPRRERAEMAKLRKRLGAKIVRVKAARSYIMKRRNRMQYPLYLLVHVVIVRCDAVVGFSSNIDELDLLLCQNLQAQFAVIGIRWNRSQSASMAARHHHVLSAFSTR